jgi:hypothetical protein
VPDSDISEMSDSASRVSRWNVSAGYKIIGTRSIPSGVISPLWMGSVRS